MKQANNKHIYSIKYDESIYNKKYLSCDNLYNKNCILIIQIFTFQIKEEKKQLIYRVAYIKINKKIIHTEI